MHAIAEPHAPVFIVDDDATVRDATVQSLELAGLNVTAFGDARSALRHIDASFAGVVVSDIRMPGFDGLQLFKAIHTVDAAIPVILITGHGDVPMAVAALQGGADDFITKPFATGHLVSSVQRGLARRQLELDNRALRALLDGAGQSSSPLVGESSAIVDLRSTIAEVAAADMPVLIEGESGTGKELVALMLHRGGQRRARPFISANCATFMAGTADDRLFGSYRDRGLIEAARHGTLLLKEVGALDTASQARVLRVIEDHEFTRRGDATPMAVDVRIVAAMRGDLRCLVSDGHFRDDLFVALDIVRVRIPALRERREDIPLLFAHFVDEAAAQLRREPKEINDRIRHHLIDHDWPGNVRELRSFAFSFVVSSNEPDGEQSVDGLANLPERIERFEAAIIKTALRDAGGSAAKTIRALGIPRKTFYDKLRRHCIDITSYRQ